MEPECATLRLRCLTSGDFIIELSHLGKQFKTINLMLLSRSSPLDELESGRYSTRLIFLSTSPPDLTNTSRNECFLFEHGGPNLTRPQGNHQQPAWLVSAVTKTGFKGVPGALVKVLLIFGIWNLSTPLELRLRTRIILILFDESTISTVATKCGKSLQICSFEDSISDIGN